MKNYQTTLYRVVVAILALCAVASIRNTSAGLEALLDDPFTIILLMSAFVFALQFVASASMFMPEMNTVLRGLAVFVALGTLFVQTRLSVIGFEAGEKQGQAASIERHPAMVGAKADLAEIVSRQNQYGVTPAERKELQRAEAQQRAYIQQLRDRLMFESRGSKGATVAAIGSEASAFRWTLAFMPEIAVLFLAPLLTLIREKRDVQIVARQNRSQTAQSPLVTLEQAPAPLQRVTASREYTEAEHRVPNNGNLESSTFDPFN